MDTLTCSLYRLTTFTSLYPFHFIVSMLSPLSFYLTSRSISFFPTQIDDLFILLHGGLSCHLFTHSIDIYSETFSREAFVISLELFYCTFVLGDMFIYCHIGLSLIVSFSLCAKKKKKQKNKRKKKQKEEKKKKKKMNKCARICIQYKYSLSSYVDL